MYLLFFVCVFFVCCSTESTNNANQYCAEQNPQSHVDIEQLMGMWYAVEIISHKHEDLTQQLVEHKDTCPILYISEDKVITTLSPIHGNYNSDERYAAGAGYGTPVPDTFGNFDLYTETPTNAAYDSSHDAENYAKTWQRYTHKQRKPRTKYLRLMWTKNRNSVEYSVHYTSKASVWFSSGPKNGSSTAYPYNDFAGTIQVAKAVGNHLVLTFCYRLPDEKFYTVLLSRMPYLRKVEIHGVHNLLTRKGLEIITVSKFCEHNDSISRNPSAIFTLVTILFVYLFS